MVLWNTALIFVIMSFSRARMSTILILSEMTILIILIILIALMNLWTSGHDTSCSSSSPNSLEDVMLSRFQFTRSTVYWKQEKCTCKCCDRLQKKKKKCYKFQFMCKHKLKDGPRSGLLRQVKRRFEYFHKEYPKLWTTNYQQLPSIQKEDKCVSRKCCKYCSMLASSCNDLIPWDTDIY